MELIFCGFFAAVLLFLLFTAIGLPSQSVDGDILKASGFPVGVIVVALVLIVVLAVGYINKCKKEGKSIFDDMFIHKNVLANVAVVVGYIALMNVLGFGLSTLLFVFINATVMGYKKYKSLTIFAIVLSIALVVVFGKFFYIPLPRGMGILRELSYYIY